MKEITSQQYDIAHSAARDAATRHMTAHGRKRWNHEDWLFGGAEFYRIIAGYRVDLINSLCDPQLWSIGSPSRTDRREES